MTLPSATVDVEFMVAEADSASLDTPHPFCAFVIVAMIGEPRNGLLIPVGVKLGITCYLSQGRPMLEVRIATWDLTVVDGDMVETFSEPPELVWLRAFPGRHIADSIIAVQHDRQSHSRATTFEIDDSMHDFLNGFIAAGKVDAVFYRVGGDQPLILPIDLHAWRLEPNGQSLRSHLALDEFARCYSLLFPAMPMRTLRVGLVAIDGRNYVAGTSRVSTELEDVPGHGPVYILGFDALTFEGDATRSKPYAIGARIFAYAYDGRAAFTLTLTIVGQMDDRCTDELPAARPAAAWLRSPLGKDLEHLVSHTPSDQHDHELICTFDNDPKTLAVLGESIREARLTLVYQRLDPLRTFVVPIELDVIGIADDGSPIRSRDAVDQFATWCAAAVPGGLLGDQH